MLMLEALSFMLFLRLNPRVEVTTHVYFKVHNVSQRNSTVVIVFLPLFFFLLDF